MDAKTEDEVIGPYDDFIEAAKYGDLAALRKCLESAELDINQPDAAEHTAFESAISCGYLKVAEVISEDPRFSVNDKKQNVCYLPQNNVCSEFHAVFNIKKCLLVVPCR